MNDKELTELKTLLQNALSIIEPATDKKPVGKITFDKPAGPVGKWKVEEDPWAGWTEVENDE